MCIVSSLLRLLCRSDCSYERFVGKLAFYPPNPSTYKLIQDGDKLKIKIQINTIHISYEDGNDVKLIYLPVENETIALFHIEQENPKGALIFCHANAVDCGPNLPRCISLGILLGFDIYTFDYEGYGLSTGETTESSLYRDIDKVYEYVNKKWKRNLFLYGESIGSVPCIYLASQDCVNIQGIILHSAILSGGDIVRMKCLMKNCNPFNNFIKANQINCPVFQIHGREDKLVPLKQAKRLARCIHSPFKPWYVSGCGHDNIPALRWSDYCRHIFAFIEAVRDHRILHIYTTDINENNEYINNNMNQSDTNIVNIQNYENMKSSEMNLITNNNNNINTTTNNNHNNNNNTNNHNISNTNNHNISNPNNNNTNNHHSIKHLSLRDSKNSINSYSTYISDIIEDTQDGITPIFSVPPKYPLSNALNEARLSQRNNNIENNELYSYSSEIL